MSTKRFFLITFFTLIFYNFFRIIGWKLFRTTGWWIRINSDRWHHWQLGILLIFVAFIIFRRRLFFRDLFLAIGSGMIIDESMYILYPLDHHFTHYSLVGIIFEFLIYVCFALIIIRLRLFKKKLPA